MTTNVYDPITGEKLKPAVAPPSARQMLYHAELEPIVVAVVSTEVLPLTLLQCKAKLAEKVKDKLKDGYLVERPHGQHPHSHDPARLQMQRRAADNGDAKAEESLDAKSGQTFKPKTENAASTDVVAQVAAMRLEIDSLKDEMHKREVDVLRKELEEARAQNAKQPWDQPKDHEPAKPDQPKPDIKGDIKPDPKGHTKI